MQICRLRFVNGPKDIIGQVINVPVDINTIVSQLPHQNTSNAQIRLFAGLCTKINSKIMVGIFITKRIVQNILYTSTIFEVVKDQKLYDVPVPKIRLVLLASQSVDKRRGCWSRCKQQHRQR